MTLRIAVIGTGWRGQRYLVSLMQRPNVNVVAVCDAHHMAAAGAGHMSGGRVYTRYELLLAHERLDAAIIASPPAFHPLIAGAAAGKGLALFLAPPLAADMSEAKTLAAEIARAEVLCLLDYPGRYHPGVLRVRSLLASQRITQFTARYRAPRTQPALWHLGRAKPAIPVPPTELLDTWELLTGTVRIVVREPHGSRTVAIHLEGTIPGTIELAPDLPEPWQLTVTTTELSAALTESRVTVTHRDGREEEFTTEPDLLGVFLAVLNTGDHSGIRSGPGSVLRAQGLTIAAREAMLQRQMVHVADVLAREAIPRRTPIWQRLLRLVLPSGH